MLHVVDLQLVSSDSNGNAGNGDSYLSDSYGPLFSPDGTKIAFTSFATNFVPGDTNNTYDIFVKDLVSGNIQRVSTSSTGTQASAYSEDFSFSADGESILFRSPSTNLVPGNGSGAFIKNLTTGEINLIQSDCMSPIYSPDGTKIAFASGNSLVLNDNNGKVDIYIKDLASGAITRASTDSANTQSNESSGKPIFSFDGTKIAFTSLASNLVTGDTNGKYDLFMKDLLTGEVTRLSTDNNGNDANQSTLSRPVFSSDGTKIAFESLASNLVPNDTNDREDIFIKDLITGEITRISTSINGTEANIGPSQKPVFSPDGTKVAFQSFADNLVDGVTGVNIYVKDLITGEVSRINTDPNGIQSGYHAWAPSFSPDGKQIAYYNYNYNPLTDSGKYDIVVVTLEENKNLTGTSGNDSLEGSMGNDTINGAQGNDTILASGGNDTIDGGTGDDSINGNAGNDSILGSSGNDQVWGDAGNDYLSSGIGIDTVYGGEGLDTLLGGIGNDNLQGGSDNDMLYGNEGNDILRGDDGDDQLDGGAGYDYIIGDNGNDTLYGKEGNDTLTGGIGNDTLRGGEDNDLLYGNEGNDILRGEAGNDTINGGIGTDQILGETGNDYLTGGNGNDTLYGGDGNDTVIGNAGADTLYGNAGADIFLFLATSDSTVAKTGRDSVFNFNQADGDKVDLTALHLDTFLATGAFTGNGLGEVRYEKEVYSTGYERTMLEVDADGNGHADMTVQFSEYLITFTAWDILL